ncbi:MAG: PfkB family carbohydrate kinase, partial [Syntrophales bacterium]|nr:PfkB family carbohydrate kinase [Syntrophales bacterium]
MDYKNKTFVIGDLILDEYIVGKEYRISDEAPVPIVKVDSFLTQLGGAANVANNLKKLGSDVILCGAIGDPSSGYSAIRFLEEMRKNDLITFCISEQPMKTTTKSRVIIKNQQVVRFDYEDNFIPKSAHEEIIEKIKIIDFRTISLIVVSDYSKGVINKEIIDL